MFKKLIWVLLVTPAIFAFQTEMVLPWVSNNANFRSKVIVQNATDAEAQVFLVATRNDGSEEGIERTIGANGQLVADAGSLFPTLGEGAGYRVLITSQGDLDAVAVVAGTGSPSGSSPAQNDGISPDKASNFLRFNYLPVGGGFSAPVVVNLGDSDASVVFHAYQGGVRIASSAAFTLAPGRPLAELTSTLFPEAAGDLYVIAESNQPLVGSAFLFNESREPSMSSARAIDGLPADPGQFNVTVYEGHVATGGNYFIDGFVYDFGPPFGTLGDPTLGALNAAGNTTLPLTREMLNDAENVILAAGIGLSAGEANANLPLQSVPAVTGFTGILFNRTSLGGLLDSDGSALSVSEPSGNVTLARWLQAGGKMTVKCNGDGTTDLNIRLENLLPHRLYTIWGTFDNNGAMWPMALGGLPNVVATDEEGNATFTRVVKGCLSNPSEGEIRLLWVDILLHSDHMVYGGIATTTAPGNDSHVHLEFFVSGTPVAQ